MVDTNKNPINFMKEVAKYFMDFLESDFHKKNAPKRAVIYRNQKNYLVWTNLKKYDKFFNFVLETVYANFEKEALTVKKGEYYTKIPQDFLDLIQLKVDQIDDSKLDEIIWKIAQEISSCAEEYPNDLEQWILNLLEKLWVIFNETLISSFLEDLEEHINRVKIWDENIIFMMREEILDILVDDVDDICKDLLKRLISWEKLKLESELKTGINVELLKNTILWFFENYRVLDLFEEISEINRNKMIMDKQDFYLYFCDITYKSAKYPIFYIPFSLVKDWWKFVINFDSQVYYNKKAIEYVVQEYNLETKNSSNLRTEHERILYVADWNIIEKISQTLDEISDFFKLNESIKLDEFSKQDAKSKFCSISNSCYISIFDKSDEALINDYEEILTKLNASDDQLWNWFKKLIDDFIYNEPKKITFEIKDKWNEKSLWEKLVYSCPIPLNEEQQQIVSAVANDECKYIIVQGPPGTWKSHTITAVVFDEILKDKSVLVLSDKKEALDVVEEKITDTMNKVRIYDDFQNPILRLWRTWNTFASISSPTHVNKISDAYFATKSKEKELGENIVRISWELKSNIEKEKICYNDITLEEIKKFFALEDEVIKYNSWIDLNELLGVSHSYSDLIEARKLTQLFNSLFLQKSWDSYISKIFSLLGEDIHSIESLTILEKIFDWCLSSYKRFEAIIKRFWEEKIAYFQKFSNINQENFWKLNELLKRYESEKAIVFGFLFKKKVLNQLLWDLKTEFWYVSTWSHSKDFEIVKTVIEVLYQWKTVKEFFVKEFDSVNFCFNIFNDEWLFKQLGELTTLGVNVQSLSNFNNDYPNTSRLLDFDVKNFRNLCDNGLLKIDDKEFDNILEYLRLAIEINKKFSDVPVFDFNSDKEKIQDLSTMKMTQIMDKRFIEFYENSKNTVMSIKKIIQKKTKFPREDFYKLKQAFPCILAWIRDYAEYIPLEQEMFDLVVIDEASQVSIAQAFPALLRAKKVLVLWDKKQFSNVKTSLASIKQNKEYLNKLHESFEENISREEKFLMKVEMFNIKSSILDFCEYICNYEAMLKKYFRWYKEIISYSNKYFYWDNLQIMKIRGEDIDNVLRFEFIEHDWRKETKPNTNSLEIEFLVKELQRLRDEGKKDSIWIITPHTNQQKALVEAINKLPDNDYYYNTLKLKIMTFDSCQWEERDIIYYSMVASDVDDHLWWVFAKNLAEIDVEEEWKLKAQRLNVWFSRAKERIVFLLSKPIEHFKWEIHNAISHYWQEKEDEIKAEEKSLKAETAIKENLLELIKNTDFYKNNSDRIKVLPQFDYWKYLVQLDPFYQHPEYKIDFLFIYKNLKNKEKKLVIEYDEFKSHGKELDKLQKEGKNIYFSEDDVYKEKVLESYGYHFIRINKFILWWNPVQSLNRQLKSLLDEESEDEPGADGVIWEIMDDIEGLSNWTLKRCPQCWEVRSLAEFKDSKLKSWYWKICVHCKVSKKRGRITNSIKQTKTYEAYKDVTCPICHAKMTIRNWRYWMFWWCSRYPYCRGTRQA